MPKLWKSANVERSYSKNKSGTKTIIKVVFRASVYKLKSGTFFRHDVMRTAVFFVSAVFAVLVAVALERHAHTLAGITAKLGHRTIAIDVRCIPTTYNRQIN